MKVAEGASASLRSLYGTRYTSGPGATTICESTICGGGVTTKDFYLKKKKTCTLSCVISMRGSK